MADEKEIDFTKMKPEHKAFCERYVYDWNGTKSYMHVYKDASYETAKANASTLLTNTNLKAYIEHIQKDLAKLAGVSALRNLTELSNVAYTNIADLKDDWMSEKAFKSLTREQKACLSEIHHTTRTFEGTKEKIVKFKLYDKLKAIDMINKMIGSQGVSKTEVTGTIELGRAYSSRYED